MFNLKISAQEGVPMRADSKLRIVILYTVQASSTLSTTLRAQIMTQAFKIICCLEVGEYILDLSYRAEAPVPALGQ